MKKKANGKQERKMNQVKEIKMKYGKQLRKAKTTNVTRKERLKDNGIEESESKAE